MAANISAKMRGGKVIITGLTMDFDDGSSIANFIYDEGKIDLIASKKIGFDRSGTGDVFFAVAAASFLNGENLTISARKAANFVTKCIKRAEELSLPWNFGLPFEYFLTDLK